MSSQSDQQVDQRYMVGLSKSERSKLRARVLDKVRDRMSKVLVPHGFEPDGDVWLKEALWAKASVSIQKSRAGFQFYINTAIETKWFVSWFSVANFDHREVFRLQHFTTAPERAAASHNFGDQFYDDVDRKPHTLDELMSILEERVVPFFHERMSAIGAVRNVRPEKYVPESSQ